MKNFHIYPKLMFKIKTFYIFHQQLYRVHLRLTTHSTFTFIYIELTLYQFHIKLSFDYVIIYNSIPPSTKH